MTNTLHFNLRVQAGGVLRSRAVPEVTREERTRVAQAAREGLIHHLLV